MSPKMGLPTVGKQDILFYSVKSYIAEQWVRRDNYKYLTLTP